MKMKHYIKKYQTISFLFFFGVFEVVPFDNNLCGVGQGLWGQGSHWFCDPVFVIAMLPLARLTQRRHLRRLTVRCGGGRWRSPS